MSLELHDQILRIHANDKRLDLDLQHLVQARLHNLSVDRKILVAEFAARLVQPLTDGLRFHLVNEEHGLFIPVVVRDAENGFRVTVKAGQIVEQLSIHRRLMTIDILPKLMQTPVGAEGYYLLPDFSGTLVRLHEHLPTVTRDRLYMHQSQWEKLSPMNCFGMQSGNRGLLGIVSQGDFFCEVVTEMNQQGRNRIYAGFGLRHTPQEPIKQEDKEVLVCFVGDGTASYFDMAKVYRQYLTAERGVSPLKERVADNPTLAYSVQAMRTKIFHGLKPRSLDGNVPMKIYATFKQSEEILDRMQDAGLRRAVVTLVGWNLGGHDGAYPQRFPVEPALGGEDGLRRLIAKARDMGYQIVPHDNLTDMYLAGQTYDPEVVLRNEDQTPVLGGIWGGGQAVKSCPVAYFDRYGPDVTRIRDLGFDGHYYCDAQSNPMFRCHDPKHPADEEQFAISQNKLTQAYRVLYGAVATEMAPAHTLPFVDEGGQHSPYNISYFQKSLDENLGRIIDRVVPFYQLAIHGLITYQESWVHAYRRRSIGPRRGTLRAIAYGARPSMEVSYVSGANGDHYEDSIRDVQDAYKLAFEDLAHTHVELVDAYDELAPEASRIVYADGTAVSINWGETPAGNLAPASCSIDR